MTRQRALAPVAVVALTKSLATSLAQELNIKSSFPMGVTSFLTTSRGQHFKTVLVEETLWPLSSSLVQAMAVTLVHHGGYVLRVSRVDLKEGK